MDGAKVAIERSTAAFLPAAMGLAKEEPFGEN
jgi:hypothetical protein